MSLYLISEVAQKAGFSTDTVRFYEKKGLIQPNFRASNQYRYYTEDALKRLIFIKRCRALGMSLKEIEHLIQLEQNPDQDCCAVNQLIDQHLSDVSNKIKELYIFKQQLKALRESCNTPTTIDHCQILKMLEAGEGS
ncbi:Cd(II)/Pb(II)-responsive transcriptional regulator [Acinetobacter bohemicus]|uniref:Cd(II)/Pb(II)-responsive transcriptional regulator n=1 Tax=unclassified Acinetobacter TaxID=196816 RepID=UPI0011742376|nr:MULTISPECIES: Cd(II)/Pb(II)-responsive transcriptional regulator [unclassified Acinetobacter]MCO8046106.1 Cd(II)/Pb(II)-responsive transcriptional regulator [Acinetobacter sp. S4397-1]TQR63303.1 Cd(II)/Pb(II)-responsive transcriptional regulator [Acinetobacter sp. RF14B]